jgi:arsenate reductase
MAWPSCDSTLGIQDPAAVEGDDKRKRRAFLHAFAELRTRIDLLTRLPACPDCLEFKTQLREIGRVTTSA